jgi:hypothetical protein
VHRKGHRCCSRSSVLEKLPAIGVLHAVWES